MIGNMKKIKKSEQVTLWEQRCSRNHAQERFPLGGRHLTEIQMKRKGDQEISELQEFIDYQRIEKQKHNLCKC